MQEKGEKELQGRMRAKVGNLESQLPSAIRMERDGMTAATGSPRGLTSSYIALWEHTVVSFQVLLSTPMVTGV